MNGPHERFIPENVEEGIELLLQGVPGHAAEIQMLRDLRALYEEDRRLIERVWRQLEREGCNGARNRAIKKNVLKSNDPI